MAQSEPVEVAVEIIDKFSDDLTELEAKLEKIDGKQIDVDLEIDDSEIEEIKARLKKLERELEATLDIDVDAAEAFAQREALEKDMNSTLHVDVDRDKLGNLGNDYFSTDGGIPKGPPTDLGSRTPLTGETIQIQSFPNTRRVLDDNGPLERFENPLSTFQSPDTGTGDNTPNVRDPTRVSDDVVENIKAIEGDFRIDSATSPDVGVSIEDDEKALSTVNRIINEDVARAHNRGIPKNKRDGWIGPDNWAFGIGEEMGRKRTTGPGADAADDFLRSITEATESWEDLQNVGANVDTDSIEVDLETGMGDPDSDRTAPEIDFLRSINRATREARDFDVESPFSSSKFGDLEFQARDMDPDLFFPAPGDGDSRGSPGFMDKIGNARKGLARRARRSVSPLIAGIGGGGAFLGGVGSAMKSDLAEIDVDPGELSGGFTRLGKTLAKYRPRIMMWWQLIALLIPMMITLAGAALGAAAALGGLAVAGGAILGLGLLGYGENAAESMKMLQERIKEVKSELFDTLRPAMKAFNPLVDQFLSNLAPAAQKLVGPLQRLGGFEGFFGEAGGGFVRFLVDVVDLIADLRPKIEAVAGVLGSVFGDLIIKLLRWAVEEIHRNMGAFLQLGSILGSLVVILYNASKAVSFVLAPFAPLFKIVAGLSSLLSNRWVTSILSAVTALLLLGGVIHGLNFLMMKLTAEAIAGAVAGMAALVKQTILLAISMARTAASGIAAMITGMYGLISSALTAIGVVGALNAALAATVALIAATGVGALLVLAGGAVGGAFLGKTHSSASDLGGGGGGGFGGYGGGGGGGATINIYGDVGNTEYQKMKDNFGELYNEQSDVNDETKK